MAQRAEKLIVITLVQTDGRLVQNIKHAHKRRTDLRCKADTLRLAARERCRLARERKIIKTYGIEERKSFLYLSDDQISDKLFLFRECKAIYKIQLLGNGHTAEFIDILAANGYGKADWRKARALAVRAA